MAVVQLENKNMFKPKHVYKEARYVKFINLFFNATGPEAKTSPATLPIGDRTENRHGRSEDCQAGT